jgi:hypothetical protein
MKMVWYAWHQTMRALYGYSKSAWVQPGIRGAFGGRVLFADRTSTFLIKICDSLRRRCLAAVCGFEGPRPGGWSHSVFRERAWKPACLEPIHSQWYAEQETSHVHHDHGVVSKVAWVSNLVLLCARQYL